MSDYIKHKEYKLPNGRTVTADFNELGLATVTIQAMDALFDILNSSDVRDDATAHKVVGGGESDGSTCWFECDNCGLAVDLGDVFCKHCGARFVP